jgi:glycerophosphoryl diester phosphodiesterase
VARELGCVAVHTAARKVRAAVVAAARQAGLALACYTVDDPGAAAKLFAAGVDAVFTDRPDRGRADRGA